MVIHAMPRERSTWTFSPSLTSGPHIMACPRGRRTCRSAAPVWSLQERSNGISAVAPASA
jgi:hypothetical protein